jgi:hypothetical protein
VAGRVGQLPQSAPAIQIIAGGLPQGVAQGG